MVIILLISPPLDKQLELVYIGLGSNLGFPCQQLQRAILSLSQLQSTELMQVANFYQSLPFAGKIQPLFVNTVVLLKTQLNPWHLLKQLQKIEYQQARKRPYRWSARTLDLDILLYGKRVINSSRLTIPHPQIAKRAFVLYPLYDITPDLVIPIYGKVQRLLMGCSKQQLFHVPMGLSCNETKY